tara:strand:+ start:29 stop:481 length:453 start_codon:yes stop_codon:yes gene_type:complete
MFNVQSGQGFQGVSPQVTGVTTDSNSIPLDRFTLRQGFATRYKINNKFVLTNRFPQTPFRLALNAGDPFSRQYEAGGSNQIQGRIGTQLWYTNGGGVNRGNGATGNQHYVYDSSIYTKYKRLANKNLNYNDYTFGGSNNGAYVPLNNLRI